jgi:diguanylate cyclase (GGDEF)-like protein
MELYLTPASINFITQTIIFLGITIYLIQINSQSKANFWLSGFYAVMVASSLAGFLAVSSIDWYEYAIYLHQIMLLIALPLLLQFSYNFPEFDNSRKKIANFGLILSITISVLALLSAILKILNVGFFTTYRTTIHVVIEVSQILILAWIIGNFVSSTFRYAQNEKTATKISIFLRPVGRIAKANRGFSLALIFLLLFWVICMVLGQLGFLSLEIYLFTTGTTWTLSLFIFTLINQTIQKSTFLFKLIGIIMLTVFTGICAAAWLAAPVSQANYLASYAIPDRQTIHFEQTNATYTITQNEFVFESDIGKQIIFKNQSSISLVELSATFPFAGKNWTQLNIDQKGFVVFEENELHNFYLNLPNPVQPIIAALYLEDLPITKNSAVFTNIAEDKSIFTWFLVSPQDNPEETISAQLSLFPDGSFDISYSGIRANFKYSPYLPKDLQQISGFFLGNNDVNPSRIQFNSLLPFTSQTWSGVYQDYYIDFRSFLNQSMSMQLFALLLVTVVTALVFPIFFQNSLGIPIKMIRSGIYQVTQDNYQTTLEPRYSDELGQTIMEFNKMVGHLDMKNTKSVTKINELEEKLAQRSFELKTSIDKLMHEVEIRKKLSESLDKSIALHKKYSTTDELTGINNRARLVEICEEEIKRAKRYNTPLSFTIMDPDYLRMVNETYGHVTGDEVLKSLIQLVQSKLRETDTIGRIGGEEFAIILPQTAGKDAIIAANRIRNIVGSQSIQTSKGPVRISTSFGISEMSMEGIFSVDLFLHRANQALDVAKNQGRNSVVLWNSNLETK